MVIMANLCLQLLLLFFTLNVCQGDNVVSLPAFSVPRQALDPAASSFLNDKPFDPYWELIGEALRTDKCYLALPYSWEDQNPELITNVTSVVVAQVTNVQLLAISAQSRTLSSVALWYVASAEVIDIKKGVFFNKTFSFLFNGGTEHAGYDWPYLRGLTHAFYFSGGRIVGQEPVSCFPPYSSKAVQRWGIFCRDHGKEVNWITKTWVDLLNVEGKVANIHFANDEFVVISRVGKYPDFSASIRNYDQVERTIISIKTREVVDEATFREAGVKSRKLEQ